MYSLISLVAGLVDAERAHALAKGAFKLLPDKILESMLSPRARDAKVDTCLGTIRNPVGLAAGFDKEGRVLHKLQMLGFGYVVAGTVTLSPRRGNPKPRIARLRSSRALVNSMGLPNPGLERFSRNIASTDLRVPLVVSVAGENVDDLLACYKKVQVFSRGVEVNLSSPSLGRRLLDGYYFKDVVEVLRHEKLRPTFLKIPPMVTRDDVAKIVRVAREWVDGGFEGVTAVNTVPVRTRLLATGYGGVSGRPLNRVMLRTVSEVRRSLGEEVVINAVGGISSVEDALRAITSGANTLQLFTALVYEGPSLVRKIVEGIDEAAIRMGYGSVQEFVSSSVEKASRLEQPPRLRGLS